MPASAFPSAASVARLYEQEDSPRRPVVASPEFADGGRDYNIAPAATKMRIFRLRYDGLTAAQAATLDAHMEEALYDEDEGSALTFSFTTRSGEVLAGVRYAPNGYRKEHVKTWSNSREVTLIDRP